MRDVFIARWHVFSFTYQLLLCKRNRVINFLLQSVSIIESVAAMLRTRQTLSALSKRFKSSAAFSEPRTLKRDEAPIDAHALTDFFGRRHTYLRISLTERCNLRCKYCMPEEGVNLSHQSKLLTTKEILVLADLFVKQGIRKIRLTGGEPTVRKDLPEIIRGLKELKGLTEGVSITTNGLVLTRQLVELQRAGLDGLNISLDTLKPERYEQITRRKGWERVLAGIDLALQLGYSPVKINCVLIKGFNDDEVIDFVEMTRDRDVDVRFIEYMPFDGNRWSGDKLVPYKKALEEIVKKYPDIAKICDGPNDTSKAYKVPNFKGQIGFITSMSDHFCGTCNRLRLTADGNLKVCLFGNTEVSLRDALRNGCGEDDLAALITAAVKRKKKQHADRKKWKMKHVGNQLFQFPVRWIEPNRLLVRPYSTEELTHTDAAGRARMVDVGEKTTTKRTASAVAVVRVGRKIAELIRENNLKKGDVLSVAQLAGIMAAKRTSEIIPLCHNIPLNDVKVHARLEEEAVVIETMVKCDGKTGVEMEALTAAAAAALTVYDMCKAVSHEMVIEEVKLLSKTGGTRGDFHRKLT
ncbi:UNVERIFIED_CONTAM: hypothetical protein PYX00_003709 [Menopon gallinae]|uniref:Molybdenum cofactor biosynthesis protein 1 n=1 Tax=Menopon gallinae TaxID=328185 RepID=A0AAW2I106_9NEOP